ncbi:hypothetical protein QA597_10510 [Marinilabiliaceae bacterium ANBcel2]|nr:hypothetical protein [Marinilabiliaceae bacterium ANBcel2]
MRGRLTSGNAIGATFYSDGDMFAPMLPEFPMVTECQCCATIFWLHSENHIARISLYDDTRLTDNIPVAGSISAETCKRAITETHYNNKDEERYLRIGFWRIINNELRINNRQSLKTELFTFWEDNINHLITMMIDSEDDNDRKLLAELYRNIGQFNDCKRELSSLCPKEHSNFINRLYRECEINNRFQVEL